MKTCTKCKLSKLETEFCRKTTAYDGLQSRCKQCDCDHKRATRRENPEPNRKTCAKWYAANRDRVLEQKHLDNAKNQPIRNRRNKLRYASDLSYKLAQNLRGRIQKAIARKSKKGAKTIELLGAPWVWVEAYLEEQFLPGMSWENHGPVWHIDHIRPCASFDLRDPEQQKICFHWTNLQPLFALDNLRKGATYDPQTS